MLGQRIKRARLAHGWSLRKLAEKVGLSHNAIKKYEHGDTTPESNKLIKLAKALGVRVEYFLRPDTPMLTHIEFRSHHKLPKKFINVIEAKVLDEFERRAELESILPQYKVPEYSPPAIFHQMLVSLDVVETFANRIREHWGLGTRPIVDLVDLLERHGIRVFFTDKFDEAFDGLYANVSNHPLIVICHTWAGERQRFTLAHELAHILLKPILDKSLDIEKACNRFAAAFLLPNVEVINAVGETRKNIEPRELAILKKEFGISMTAILYRLKELEVINTSTFTKYLKEFKEKGWIRTEPTKPYPKEHLYFQELLVFRAYAENLIGDAKAAELLGLTQCEFQRLKAMEGIDDNSG